ncbi:MAG: DUF4097 family beta strand repeat-containing protein [Chitinophagaceae bacterium]
MKAIQKVYSAILVIAVSAFSSKAHAEGDPLIELKKTISKSFTVNSNEKVSINHQFGELVIHTWDKNEVKAEINIKVSSEDEEYARSVLDAISIDAGKNANGVYFRTIIGDIDKKRSRRARNENRNIDYVVYLPAVNPLLVNMQFGSTNIADYKGPVEIIHEYGSLTTGNLSNVKSISASYGSASIGGVSNGKLRFEYGDTKLFNVSGVVTLNTGYGSVKLSLDNSLKSLDMKSEYGDIQLGVQDNINASFTVETSYAELKNKGGLKFVKAREDESGPVFDHTYTATGGNGSAKVKIKSEFTQVTVSNSVSFESSKDKGTKKKEKSI